MSRARMRLQRSIVAIAALSLVAGCASFTRLEPPKLEATSVRIVSVALPTVNMVLGLTLANPNPRDVTIASLDARLSIDGQAVATARLPAPATLPANGTTTVMLDARGDASAALGSLGRTLGAARPLNYEIAGEATLADGTRFPFWRRGETGAIAR